MRESEKQQVRLIVKLLNLPRSMRGEPLLNEAEELGKLEEKSQEKKEKAALQSG